MPNKTENRLEIQRAYKRKYQDTYRRNSPDKKRANDLRYYVRQLVAAGYIVTEPGYIVTEPATPGRVIA